MEFVEIGHVPDADLEEIIEVPCDKVAIEDFLQFQYGPFKCRKALRRQPGRRHNQDFRQGTIDGAYWIRAPGPNCAVVIAYQGALADEAIAAAGLIGAGRRDIGVLAITSADRLNARWTAAQRERARGNPNALSHAERLLAGVPPDCVIVTVIDGHPATLSWLGGLCGHRTLSMAWSSSGRPARSVTSIAISASIARHSFMLSMR